MWTLAVKQLPNLTLPPCLLLAMEKKSDNLNIEKKCASQSVWNETMARARDEIAFVRPVDVSPSKTKADKRRRCEESDAKEKVHKVAKRLLKFQKQHSSSSHFSSCRTAAQETPLIPTIESAQQAQRQGQQLRNLAVLPSQILPALQAYFPKKEMPLKRLEHLALVICREINQLTLSEPTTCTSLRLEKKANTHVFPILGALNISKQLPRHAEYQELFMGYDCWLEMSPDGKEFRVLLIELDEDGLLGKGVYKEVYKAHNIEIGLTAQPGEIAISTRSVSIKPEVFMHAVLEEAEVEEEEEGEEEFEFIETIAKGLEIQKTLLDRIPASKANLISLPKALQTSDPFCPAMERRQEWYNGDLQQAMQKKTLPLGIHKTSPKTAISLKQCLRVLLDVTATLREMHALGIVHMDLKPSNIFIKLKDSEACGFLADFDLSINIGSAIRCNCVYWDERGKNGLATPFSDYHSLAICVAQVILGGEKDVIALMKDVKRTYKDPKQQKEWEESLQRDVFKAAVLEASRLIEDLTTRQALLDVDAHWNRTLYPQTSAQNLARIQAFLDRTDLHLSEQPRHILQHVKTDISLVTMACQLLIKAVQHSEQVDDYFFKLSQSDPASYDILYQDLPKDDPVAEKALMAKKLQIIENCSKALGGYTIEHIEQDIEAILKMLEGKEAM